MIGELKKELDKVMGEHESDRFITMILCLKKHDVLREKLSKKKMK